MKQIQTFNQVGTDSQTWTLLGARGELVKKKHRFQSSHHGTAETNPARNHEVERLIPVLAQ